MAFKSLLKESTYTNPLASWPQGTQILVSNDFFDPPADVVDILCQHAQSLNNSFSLVVLLQFNVSFGVEDWYAACDGWSHYTTEEGIADDAEQARRTQIFDAITSRILPYTNVLSKNTDPDAIDRRSSLSPLDHTSNLSVLAAEIAWGFGHRNLNAYTTDGSLGQLPGHIGTPLWFISTTMRLTRWHFYFPTF
jgi:hypothetical protein